MEKKRTIILKQDKGSLGSPLLEWTFSESESHKKDIKWYSVVVLVGAALSLLLALQQLWTGVVLVVISVLLLIVSSGKKTKNVKCAIYDQGIVMEDRVYEYNSFKSFWLAVGEHIKVKFQTAGRFGSQIIMPLSTDIEIEKIREVLSKHLPEEEEKGEDLVDVINRISRF